jgi:hypothetical protein
VRNRGAAAAVCAAALLAAGCGSLVGPKSVGASRADFGEALSRSWNEQLLKNLVRLRYRDSIQFLEVGSVVTSFTRTMGASAGMTLKPGTATEGSVGALAGFSESPTITFSPLQGEAFTQRMLSPFTVEVLISISNSGWSVERLLSCCTQSVNGIPNAPPASGPTPSYVPPFTQFRHLGQLLRRLQVAGLLYAEVHPDGKVGIAVLKTEDPDLKQVENEVRTLLKLDSAPGWARLIAGREATSGAEIAIVPRSLLSVLFFLSQGVEVPAEHEREGLVTVTKRPDGSRFDWAELMSPLFRVRTSPGAPERASVAVPYRGHWFYIADDDLDSKTTFSLLTFLFSLKAGAGDLKEPTLTLGVR